MTVRTSSFYPNGSFEEEVQFRTSSCHVLPWDTTLPNILQNHILFLKSPNGSVDEASLGCLMTEARLRFREQIFAHHVGFASALLELDRSY